MEKKLTFLLACIHQDSESKEQVKILEGVLERFSGVLRVGLLNNDRSSHGYYE